MGSSLDNVGFLINKLPPPFNFYKLLLKSDMLHFGYWSEETASIDLEDAQESATKLLLDILPTAPSRVLDVGCGLGATSALLTKLGYDVVAITPDESMIDYAQERNPGPKYVLCGFMDDHTVLQSPQQYDIILMQESLQYFPDIKAVFQKIASLLRNNSSRVVLCDEVSYSKDTIKQSSIKMAVDIEKAFLSLGFNVKYHLVIGKQVYPTCIETLSRFKEKRQLLIETFDKSEGIVDHFIQGWKYQEDAYRNGILGYEVWELQPGEICVHDYKEGDENTILNEFNETFGIHRTMNHWKWKYKQNPFNETIVSVAWHDNTLAGHYAGYPLNLSLKRGLNKIIYQLGDTFTIPAYRHIGKGSTSVLARTFRHFEQTVKDNSVYYNYGFNTDKIRRFGQLFLGYVADTPVYSWLLTPNEIEVCKNKSMYLLSLKGYSITKHVSVGPWAEQVFTTARKDYDWLVFRDQSYLRWRYDEHPDFTYTFYLVKRWNKPIGYWLIRQDGKNILIGDAVFCQRTSINDMKAGIIKILKDLPDTKNVEGWFSETPSWWNRALSAVGFIKKRQYQNLYLCCKSYSDHVTPEDIAKKFYFTWGDSDLF